MQASSSDVETLRPTYRLLVGVAGKSNAFAIASCLGLAPEIIRRAESKLTQEHRRVDEVIGPVEIDRSSAARDRREAERLKERYQILSEKYHDAFERLKAARDGVLDEARREARSILLRAQRESEELLGRLRKAGADRTLETGLAHRRPHELCRAAERDRGSRGRG